MTRLESGQRQRYPVFELDNALLLLKESFILKKHLKDIKRSASQVRLFSAYGIQCLEAAQINAAAC